MSLFWSVAVYMVALLPLSMASGSDSSWNSQFDSSHIPQGRSGRSGEATLRQEGYLVDQAHQQLGWQSFTSRQNPFEAPPLYQHQQTTLGYSGEPVTQDFLSTMYRQASGQGSASAYDLPPGSDANNDDFESRMSGLNLSAGPVETASRRSRPRSLRSTSRPYAGAGSEEGTSGASSSAAPANEPQTARLAGRLSRRLGAMEAERGARQFAARRHVHPSGADNSKFQASLDRALETKGLVIGGMPADELAAGVAELYLQYPADKPVGDTMTARVRQQMQHYPDYIATYLRSYHQYVDNIHALQKMYSDAGITDGRSVNKHIRMQFRMYHWE